MFDSHAHLISDDAEKYPPSPPSGELKPGELDDPMTAERLLENMDKNGVGKAVLVQRGSIYGFDSSYVCDSAARYPDRFSAVCAIDANADNAPDTVRHWINDKGAAGIRLMELVKEERVSWLASLKARDVWRTARQLQVPVCVHFFPWNRELGLTSLKSILDELPEQTVVIDHFSNMNARSGPPDYGIDDLLKAVMAFPNVYLKFTTIPLGRLHDAGIDGAPIVARVVEEFGAGRLMWGSDVTQSPGTYDHMVNLGRQSVALLDEAQRSQILEGSVRTVYGKKWS